MTDSPMPHAALKKTAYDFVVAESTTFRLDRSSRFWGAGVLLLGVIACATGDVAQPSLVSSGAKMEVATVNVAPPKPQIDIASYIGEEASDLEMLVGAPALVRNAGAYEFRRYNINDCRIMAVVSADANGIKTVSELKVVDVKVAGPSRDFNSCV